MPEFAIKLNYDENLLATIFSYAKDGAFGAVDVKAKIEKEKVEAGNRIIHPDSRPDFAEWKQNIRNEYIALEDYPSFSQFNVKEFSKLTFSEKKAVAKVIRGTATIEEANAIYFSLIKRGFKKTFVIEVPNPNVLSKADQILWEKYNRGTIDESDKKSLMLTLARKDLIRMPA